MRRTAYNDGGFGPREVYPVRILGTTSDLGERWIEKYPDGPAIGVGDISRQSGAAWPDKWHKGHRDGKNVDIRPIRNDGKNDRVTIHDKMNYDQAKTRELIVEILKDDNVCAIWFNDGGIRETIKVLKSDAGIKHDNHIHVHYCE